jgi:RES domain-containing protein
VITGWRIVKRKYAADAFSGEGARIAGGRWNSPGSPLVYIAGSRSLAVLEILAHIGRATLLPAYVLISCSFEETLVLDVETRTLPAGWRGYPSPPALQTIGDRWLREATSAVLRVPSAIIPAESNYLLNPAHGDFSTITVQPPEHFEFDLRLLT